MLARNWHDDAISSELGSFCQKWLTTFQAILVSPQLPSWGLKFLVHNW
jgi:hypothetical protein